MAFDWKKLLGIVAPIVGGIFGGPAGAAIGGAVGGGLQGGKPSQWIPNALFGAGAGYGGAKLTRIGGGGNPLKSLGGMFGGSNPSQIMTSLGPGVRQGMAQQSSSQGGLLGGLGGLIKKNPLATLGVGTMLGSQFIKSPQVPELPQSVIDFQNTARQGNPLQNQAAQALQQQLGMTQQDASADEIAALNRQYDIAQEEELKSIDSMYKSLRPGTDPLTDTAYQKDLGRVRDRYATLRADSTANFQRQISNDFATQRAQQIASAAGLSQQQLAQLAQASQYDLERVLAQYNINDRDAEFLRNYLFQFGGDLLSSQLGVEQNPLSGFLSLLGRN